MRPSRLATALSFLVVFAGCGGGGDKSTKPIVPSDGLPDGTPKADSPAHLMQRFEATWESKVEAQYTLLLADDFRYHFSPAADPELANLYGENWRKSNEVDAITNLFHGFQNGQGQMIPGASRIDLTLTGVQYGSDPDHPDSTAQYQRVVVVAVDGVIEVPGSPYPTSYNINARHEFYLVRGDAAVLAAGASADTTHWYIRKWDDLSVAGYGFRKGPVINPASSTTLGSIRSFYASPPPAARTP